jgi:hypothetical protein
MPRSPPRMPLCPVQSANPASTEACARLGQTDTANTVRVPPSLVSNSPSMRTPTHVTHIVESCFVIYSPIRPMDASTLSSLKIDPPRSLYLHSLFFLLSTRPGKIVIRALTVSSALTLPSSSVRIRISHRSHSSSRQAR